MLPDFPSQLEGFDPAGPPDANVYFREPIAAYGVDRLLLGRVEAYRMPAKTIIEMKGLSGQLGFSLSYT